MCRTTSLNDTQWRYFYRKTAFLLDKCEPSEPELNEFMPDYDVRHAKVCALERALWLKAQSFDYLR